MKPSEVFAQHRDTIREMVLQSGMTNPRLFGSALHGDDLEGATSTFLSTRHPARASSIS